MFVHPHPDDESIACGGTLARYVDEGVRVMVITCTGGEEGDNLAGIDLAGQEMAAVRRRELAAALSVLGVEHHVMLGYRDSGMAGTSGNRHPDSFHRADLEEAATRLAGVLRTFRPDVVVSDDERGTYGHPDHVKAHAVTTRGVELAAAPDAPLDVPPWEVAKRYVHALPKGRLLAVHHRLVQLGLASPFGDVDTLAAEDVPFGVDDHLVTTALDVRPWLERKRDAMRAHASQIGAESFFLNLPADVAEDTFGTEYYVLADGVRGAAGVEDDLLAGLRSRRPR
ncbi:MAG TPA: N-acetyl-1-D-myo-inositol-2-amino-2-deoxy-alpha-D-glucopyranoside deacetylase [Nitriliruptorales bacterium]|nr:N-acetyl-1-D-myo-inositol-2-amino-2-deoxy-alpha-D-glucopyranoside deacetylase [Nitriliruptorales bacterium]